MKNIPNTFVLFGPNGGGKGTQAKKIKKEYGHRHFEMSAALKAAENDIIEVDGVKMSIKNAMAGGILLPDKVVQDIVDRDLSARVPGDKALYDGVGRTIVQAKNLVTSLQDKGLFEGTSGLLFDVPETQARLQIAMRALLDGRPDDASEKAVDRRLGSYYSKTMESVRYFESLQKLIRVDGRSDVNFTRIIDVLNSLRERFGDKGLFETLQNEKPEIVEQLNKSVEVVTERLFSAL